MRVISLPGNTLADINPPKQDNIIAFEIGINTQVNEQLNILRKTMF